MDGPCDDYSEIRAWWKEVYERTKRQSFLKDVDLFCLVDVLPLPIFNRVLQMLDLEAPSKGRLLDTTPITTKHLTDNSVDTLMSSDYVNVPLPSSSSLNPPNNPYIDFFRRPAGQMKTWRNLDAKSTVTTSLDTGAENLVRDIAQDFVLWFQSLGGEHKTNITVQTLLHMFEVGSQQNGAKCLSVEVKEQASVPEAVAKSFGKPERSSRFALMREIERDARAATRRPKVTAFGSSLPGEMRQTTQTCDFHENWRKQVRLRKSLTDMSAVWEGITHLKSTRGYCEFLVKTHPEVKPPKYLVESGLFKKLESPSSPLLG